MKKVYDLFVKLLKLLFSLQKIDKKIIVFESSSDFCDSSRTVYEYMKKNCKNKKYKYFWLVEEIENFKNTKDTTYLPKRANIKNIFGIIHKIYIESKAKYCFYTHYFVGNKLQKKQIRVFLTHASPPVKNSKGNFWNPYDNSMIISTSEFAAKYRCETFGGGLDIVKYVGLPRNDDLFINKKRKEEIKQQMQITGFDKYIIWMPTFKHNKNHNRNDFKSKNDNDLNILTQKNIKKINNKLKEDNNIMFIKMHPGQNMEYINIKNESNIKIIQNAQLLDKDIKVYEFLGMSDALITDFSSVYFDYLLLNKPIAFELNDIELYKKGIGFIEKEPLKIMPGNKIQNINDFLDFLSEIKNGKDEFQKERIELRNKNHKFQDNKTCKRLIEMLQI